MNPLPRCLALALFVALAALVALLAGSIWRSAQRESAEVGGAAERGSTAETGSRRAVIHSQRLALGLASAALVLTLIMIVAGRRPRANDAPPPFAIARSEIGTLARLAETSGAQSAALDRKRDVRRLAEEDAELQQHLLAQSLEEKIRLGRDLHDGIIQSLYAVGLTLESVRAIVKSDPEDADRRLEQTRTSLNNAIRDVRAYIGGLTPANLRRSDFARAIGSLLAELSASREAQLDVNIDEEAAARLTPDQSIEALQIVREAASNALRHGGASRITERVHQSDREICLLVQDNGGGFDASSRRDGGHGLGNMQARAERLGASLRVTSRPGEGTRVIAILPILAPTTA